jgi:hypothetical protein
MMCIEKIGMMDGNIKDEHTGVGIKGEKKINRG